MEFTSRNLLQQHKELILNRWYQDLLDGYEEQTVAFLRGQSDRFANPVAYALKAAMEEICQALVDDRDVDRAPLDYAMKVKAVQVNDAAQGVAFIHTLKEIIRRTLGNSVTEAELVDLDNKVDRIVSIAKDMFLVHRAKIADIAARLSVPIQNRI